MSTLPTTALPSTVRPRRAAKPRALGPIVALAAAALGALPGTVAHATTLLADQPLFAASDAPGNLALVLSVEFPTAISVAHLDRDYKPAQEYLGLFDPGKCYRYLGATAATTTAVTDGSFETPSQGGGYSYGTTGGAWTFANGGGLTANQSAFTNGNPNTADGQQVAFLQNGGTATQTFTATAGTTYTVAFRAAQRGNSQSGTQIVRVSIDGVALGTFQPPGTAYTSSPTYSFTATSSSHTIQLAGVGGGGSDYTAFVDSVVVVDASSPAAAPADYFRPVGLATARRCSGEWSGNFLNWATMQIIDPFRWVLTGGYRVIDTTTMTVLEKACDGNSGSGIYRPQLPGRASSRPRFAGATPFGSTGTPLYMRIWGLGNKMRFALPRRRHSTASPWLYGGAAPFNSQRASQRTPSTKSACASRCATRGSGCSKPTALPYGANYKPEGLIQKYSNTMRYSAFGYLNDDDMLRDGGVLRARQKFVGSDAAGARSPAPARRTRRASGVRPTASSCATRIPPTPPTPTRSSARNVQDSGVINYLNKFGQMTTRLYKTYDPVSELTTRRSATSEPRQRARVTRTWSTPERRPAAELATASRSSPTWDDPILYSCQTNSILGIGDVNTWADKNLPGSTMTRTSRPSPPRSRPTRPSTRSTRPTRSASSKAGGQPRPHDAVRRLLHQQQRPDGRPRLRLAHQGHPAERLPDGGSGARPHHHRHLLGRHPRVPAIQAEQPVLPGREVRRLQDAEGLQLRDQHDAARPGLVDDQLRQPLRPAAGPTTTSPAAGPTSPLPA